MRSAIQTSLLQKLIKHRNAYLGIAAISLSLNIVLAITVFASLGRERIVIVPPNIPKTFWVGASNVSAEYLAEMSQFFVNLRFNISPASAQSQREMLLHYVDPSVFEALKTQMIGEAAQLNKEHISMMFYPSDIKVDAKALQTLVTGSLVTIVGDTVTPAKHITYKLTYSYHSGRLWVKAFKEVQKNA